MGYSAASPGGSSAGGQEVLWAWNGVDTTQFAVAQSFKRDTGGTPLGSVALSVVDAAVGAGQKALRVTGTGVQGGFFFPITSDELTLPDRYVVAWRIVGSSLTNAAVMALFVENNAIHRGALHHRPMTGVGNINFGGLVNDEFDIQTQMATGGAFNAALMTRGGERHMAECWRQRGSTPAKWYVEITGRSPHTAAVNLGNVSEDSVIGTPNWDGADCTLLGPGIYSAGAATDMHVEIMDFRVYAWPGPLG